MMVDMKRKNPQCKFCTRPVTKPGSCVICDLLTHGALWSCVPILIIGSIIQSLFHFEIIYLVWGWLLCASVMLIIFIIRAISGIGFYSLIIMTREGMYWLMIIIICGAILFTPFLCIGLILHYMDENKAAKARMDALYFRETVQVAMDINKEGTYSYVYRSDPIVYPLHSLVVFTPGANIQGRNDGSRYVFTINANIQDWNDKDLWEYQNACPRKWLATKKEEVKFVAIVTKVEMMEIGHYDSGGSTAYGTTWNVIFVDLVKKEIVSIAYIKENDPERLDDPFSRNSGSSPTDSEIVSAIREHISFTK
jgi:hypothetical protein